ncbi:MAG: type II secretion system protein [Phycisphaerales bacterium]|nr:type II secretion system protein [Phycisphaerales bacterium]
MNQYLTTRPAHRFGAFTMIETVFVISLIALLAAITIGVGSSMANAGKQRATEGVIQVLDRALSDYIEKTGKNPEPLVSFVLVENSDAGMRGDLVYYPVFDGTINLEIVDPDSRLTRHHTVNSVGLFLKSIESGVDVDALLETIDSSMIRQYDVPDDLQPSLTTVFDSWGNPIRYVHPLLDGIIEDSTNAGDRRAIGDPGDYRSIMTAMDGFFSAGYLPEDSSLIPFMDSPVDGEVRRNRIVALDNETARANGSLDYPIEADSDGGRCPTRRPYFYSAGPDGDPSTIEDNIYTTVPLFDDPF